MGAGLNRARYLAWAVGRIAVNPDVSCPACGATKTSLVRRKYLVTSLRQCSKCGLRFRCPKGDPEADRSFYVNESYKQQGLTTGIPTPEQLAELVKTGFVGSEKDFTPRIAELRQNGVEPGAKVLDFGSSWGYGSWQFTQAGFKVFSYEIGKRRAQYSKDALNCDLVEDLRTLHESVDCFFTSHVIEHLTNPRMIFEEARKTLVPGGVLICYCPNGASERESTHGTERYDKSWGAVHPLMITPAFMTWAAENTGFEKPVFRSDENGLSGVELLTIARKAH